MTSSQHSVPSSGSFAAQYLVGLLLVVGCLAGGMIATAHTVGQLAGDIRAGSVPACQGTASAGCRADYPATVVAVNSGDESDSVVLSTSFLADTAQSDECFGDSCRDQVGMRTPDIKRLHAGQPVTISAAQGRIYTVTASGSSFPTYDSPAISALGAAAGVTAALYLDIFGIAWLAAYLLLTLRFRAWRAIGPVAGVALAGAVASFAGYSLGGPDILVLAGTGLLIVSGAGLSARRHPRGRQPAPLSADPRWRQAYGRAVFEAFYVLGALPLELGIAVAFRLGQDGGTPAGPVFSVLIGLAITAFIFHRLHRYQTRPRKARPPAVATPVR